MSRMVYPAADDGTGTQGPAVVEVGEGREWVRALVEWGGTMAKWSLPDNHFCTVTLAGAAAEVSVIHYGPEASPGWENRSAIRVRVKFRDGSIYAPGGTGRLIPVPVPFDPDMLNRSAAEFLASLSEEERSPLAATRADYDDRFGQPPPGPDLPWGNRDVG